MNTLVRVSDVLNGLHQQAEATDGPLMEAFEGQDVAQLMTEVIEAEHKDLEGLYRGYAGNFLSVSPEFGRFLYSCARACRARRIVEFGSSMGVSSIYLAAALRDNGGGRLIGTDLEGAKAERAMAHLELVGLSDLVEFRVGDARETLSSGLGGEVDMVLLDGAFTLYLPVLKLLEPHLRPGAIVIGENAFAQGHGYIDYVRNPANGYLSQPLPFEPARGNEFTVRTG